MGLTSPWHLKQTSCSAVATRRGVPEKLTPSTRPRRWKAVWRGPERDGGVAPVPRIMVWGSWQEVQEAWEWALPGGSTGLSVS